MVPRLRLSSLILIFCLCFITLVATACNLNSSEVTQQIDLTTAPTITPQPTRTIPGTTTRTVPTSVILPTNLPPINRPTSIILLPPTSQVILPPTNTPLPVNIAILSPVPGNVVSGSVQVVGAAAHPQFLQYQLEYGPDPNPGNLWYPATYAVQTPVLNGLLGIWNTTLTQDANYQLRVRVYLRDGSTLTTVVNNIRVQNRQPTPVPTATQNIPRPIAAFTQNTTTGTVPFTVQFTNQSAGTINRYLWNFGDGATSADANPSHTFTSPGLYSVTLTVEGPGGTSNVTRQISAQSATPPVAGFTLNTTTGIAPLAIQFTDQSTGVISGWQWNFSDGTTSTDRNPSHVFTTAGVYNVLLTVTGPGGSSFATRQIVVQGPTPTFTPTWTFTPVTPTLTFTPITPTLTNVPPTLTFTPETPTLTNIPPTLTFTPETPTLTFTPITPTLTNVPPTLTFTPETPTLTFTPTVTPETPTLTFTPIPPTETPTLTFTPIPPTETPTLTFTPIPPTETPTLTFTPIPPTETPTLTFTPIPPTETPTTIPMQLGFTAQQQSGTLAVAFTNTTTGAVAYFWDFGDGSNSSEANPVHNYAQGGTYTVTLTAADAANNQQQVQQQVNVVQAGFTATPTDLSVSFTNSSLGNISGYYWEFGDGNTSSDANPVHAYGAEGTYTVRLTVTAVDGFTTHSTEQPVSVTAPVSQPTATTAIDPGMAAFTDVQPNIGNIQQNLRSIYENGVTNFGRLPYVFAFAGDSTFAQSGIIDAFSPNNFYDLGNNSDLQSVIDWYNSYTGTSGTTSFNSLSAALNGGYKAADLNNPSNAPAGCNPGETPLQCEIRDSNASVILIAVGYNDALSGTNINPFTNELNTIVQTAISNGVIPVLFTIRPSADGGALEQQTAAINDAIISVANSNSVPVVNLWRALNDLPNDGIEGSDLSTSPNGAGDLSDSALSNYGASVTNLNLLRVLNALRNQVFPDAALPSASSP